MSRTTHRLVFVMTLLAMVSAAYALNYMYVSDEETTVFGDRIKWWSGDTLNGPIRTNDTFAIMQRPVFYDYVIQTAADFWRGTAYNPYFLTEEYVVFGAPEIPWPENADWHREQAFQQGFYFDAGDSMHARIELLGDTMRVSWTRIGVPFDSSAFEDIALPDSAIVWFESSIRVSGIVEGTLILCSDWDARLEDNLLYASSTGNDGRVTPNHVEKFALIAEHDIKVLNTVANGRENSGGEGNGQSNPDSTDIALNGFYYALGGSFTFENQNDPDSGYVCACQPDDRGMIYLWGGLGQLQRGYVHRSTRTSTGYLKQYRYDGTLRHWDIGLFDLVENEIEPDHIDFGTVAVGDTARDTVLFTNEFVPLILTHIETGSPFRTETPWDNYCWVHRIPVEFVPSAAGMIAGVLSFTDEYYGMTYHIGLSGVGYVSGVEPNPGQVPAQFVLSVFPNPFNAETRIRYTLPQSSDVVIGLVDMLGREVRRYEFAGESAGAHEFSLDGSDLGTGIYFVRLAAGGRVTVTKVVLLK